MSCTLDKYTNYEASQVIKDGDRTVVKLAHPPAGCPDGTLNNSHTTVIEDAAVSVPTLSFSTRLNAPVVLMPHHAATTAHTVRVDPVDVPKDTGIGFFGVCGWILGIVLVALAVKWLLQKMKESPATDFATPQGTVFAGRSTVAASPMGGFTPRRATRFYPSAPRATSTTVVNNVGGGGSHDGFLTGMIVGNMMHGDTGTRTEPRPSKPWPTEPERSYRSDPEPTPSSSYSSNDSPSSYSSDSGSSYSSDSSSSYSSDSSSSFSSDSGSSFGSD